MQGGYTRAEYPWHVFLEPQFYCKIWKKQMHQKRSQYLRTASLSSKDSPEKRATRTILLLVSFFVVMHWADLSISSSSSFLRAYDPVVLGVQRLVRNVYASVSPLVLLTSNKRIINILQNMQQQWHRFLTN
nr:vomeronasal type-1 receptor 53 [Microcebus murinus]